MPTPGGTPPTAFHRHRDPAGTALPGDVHRHRQYNAGTDPATGSHRHWDHTGTTP